MWSESKRWLQGRNKLRLAVVSPFLDRQHGTELCIIEQIERLARREQWQIEVYSQRVEQVENVLPAESGSRASEAGIFWHKISSIPGPHLLKYLWWFTVNQVRRWRDRVSGKVCADLTYSPGINCLDADAVVVHIVFHEFYGRLRSQLALRRSALRTWPLILHRKLYYKLIMSLERRVYRDPKVSLVAVSLRLAEQMKVHFGRTDIAVIPNSTDIQRFNATARSGRRKESRSKFGYSEDEFVLLFIGNDWKNKGLDALLKACLLLSDIPWRLMVVGQDDRSSYLSTLQQPTLQGRVRFEKPSADVLKFYAAVDLYISPSREDSFGLPILEAMACGLPVIASIQAGASENICHGQTGLLLHDPQDATEIARHIRVLFNDGPLQERIRCAAAQYAQENCSWDQNAAKTKEFLEATLRKRHEV